MKMFIFSCFTPYFYFKCIYSCACLSDCPIGFETQNYSILTNKCKAPHYPPTECCDAFKEFACPFAVYINNQSTNCADTMLTYINVHGSYPPALFADECQKGKEGVAWEGIPEIGTGLPCGGRRVHGISRHTLVALLCGIGALLFHWVTPCSSTKMVWISGVSCK